MAGGLWVAEADGFSDTSLSAGRGPMEAQGRLVPTPNPSGAFRCGSGLDPYKKGVPFVASVVFSVPGWAQGDNIIICQSVECIAVPSVSLISSLHKAGQSPFCCRWS